MIAPSAGSTLGAADVATLKNVVMVSRQSSSLKVPAVVTDAMSQATAEPIGHGHSHIAAVLGRQRISTLGA